MTQKSLQTANGNDLFKAVNECTCIEEAVALIKKVDALKVALDAVDRFYEQAVMYARLECEALLKVVELGGIGKLRGHHRKTAEWLAELSEDEREVYIEMCKTGCTIDHIYAKEVGDPKKVQSTLDGLRQIREKVIDSMKENGIVDTRPFVAEVNAVRYVIGEDVATDIVDGMRNRLRKVGGLGVGEGTHLYVMPNSPHTEEVEQAILTRYKSICNDMDSIKDIARASKIKMSYKKFCSNPYQYNLGGHYLVWILACLDTIGLYSDSTAFADSLFAANVYEEAKQFTKYTKLGRAEYIKREYQKILEKEKEDGEQQGQGQEI